MSLTEQMHHLAQHPQLADRFEGTLDWSVIGDEFAWRERTRPTIFIATTQAVDAFLRARYSLDDIRAIAPPFAFSSLALPKGCTVDGVTIPPCLAGWMRYGDYRRETMDKFYEKVGRSAPIIRTDVDEDEQVLAVNYADPYGDPGTRGRSFLTETSFLKAVQAGDYEEFSQLCGTLEGSAMGALSSDKNDLVIQHTLLKLVLAVAIYNQATNGERLLEGTPGHALGMKMSSSLAGLEAKNRYSHFTLKIPERSLSEHYRTWHFRQLKADRYYRGEHADKRPGSRVVFVSDTTIGGDRDNYTQD